MEYQFKPVSGNGTYQLVETKLTWLLKREYEVKHPVYIEYNPLKQLRITAEDAKGSANSDLLSVVEANKFTRIFGNLGITQKVLLETGVPLDLNPNIVDHWAAGVRKIFAASKK